MTAPADFDELLEAIAQIAEISDPGLRYGCLKAYAAWSGQNYGCLAHLSALYLDSRKETPRP